MPKPQRERPSTPSPIVAAGTSGLFSSKRATYPAAVARYEAGMRALQQHQYAEAAEAFRAVLVQFPEEKELADRIRLYLAVCDRHLRAAPEPRTLEERLYAATLALNAGDRATALRHLGEIVASDPNHDGALYMLGVAHALGNERDQAVAYLRQAIARNPDNRALALHDADLAPLMQDESVRTAVQGTPGGPRDLRTPHGHRPIR